MSKWREAAHEFAEAVGLPPDEEPRIAARMADMAATAPARNEVQRWHEQDGHGYAGAHRCPQCIADGKWAKR